MYVTVKDSSLDKFGKVIKAFIEVDAPQNQIWVYVPNDVVTPQDYTNWYAQCAEDFRANNYSGTAYQA